jgi:hypothetical protein
MKALQTLETPVSIYQSTLHNNPKTYVISETAVRISNLVFYPLNTILKNQNFNIDSTKAD